ncbi:HlyD family efflux transporter periplasmic adaptor subunit [Roseburia hominis]
MQREVTNLKTYKRKGTWNIGVILFGVVFIYLAVSVLIYLTKDRIAVYEVREGSILKDTAYTGIVLRTEQVVTADQGGYVNYFLEEGQKTAVGANIYTISKKKLEDAGEKKEDESVTLTSEDWNSILMKAQAFNESYRPVAFSAVATLKNETNAVLTSKSAQNRITQLNSLLSGENAEDIFVYTAQDDGVLVYSTDGFEELSLGDVTEEHLAKAGYMQNNFSNNMEVKAGDPVYKLITGEEWTLVIKLTKEMEETLLEKMGDKDYTSVKVRFTKDNETMWATLRIYNRGKDDAYGYFTFYNSMIRYASERYLDIELILEDESGLKIPKSALTTKDFFIVPEDYLTTGGASKETGVLRQTKDKKGTLLTEFVPVTVFYRDTESGMVYLDKSLFNEGDVLLREESTETTKIGQTDSLKGVYNVNKGYAVFKQVHILCESEEYYIVEEGNRYGLSNYDHIALDGSSVQENALVTQ